MKYKISPVFLQSLWISTLFLGLSNFAWAQSELGILEGLEKIISANQRQAKKLNVQSENNPIALEDSANTQRVRLDPYYLRSLMLHSQERFFDLIDRDICLFLSSLEAGLLKDYNGKAQRYVLRYQKK